MAALPRTWFLCFLLSSIIEVVVYFHEFHQKPATLDRDGIVISTPPLMSEQCFRYFREISREVPQTVWIKVESEDFFPYR